MIVSGDKTRYMFLILYLFIGFSIILAQNTIKGYVVELNNNQTPIPNATVYINGTVTGTLTADNGYFELNNVVFPCQLTVSRVGYDLKIISLDQPVLSQQIIALKDKMLSLSEVKITGKNIRDSNVQIFKDYFLGTDKWGKKAVLKNDSILIFDKQIDTIRVKNNIFNQHYYKNSQYTILNDTTASVVFTNLKVIASQPLIIELPLLGYTVNVDLVKFNLTILNKQTHCSFLGSYFYKPYLMNDQKAFKRYEKNRQEAFYNSIQDFCRTFYSGNFLEKGYLVAEKVKNDSSKLLYDLVPIEWEDFVTFRDDNKIKINGKKDKVLYVFDCFNYANKPVDLSKLKKKDMDKFEEFFYSRNSGLKDVTALRFQSDTCTIMCNGYMPDNNITFSGKMTLKKVGAMVPSDYKPAN